MFFITGINVEVSLKDWDDSDSPEWSTGPDLPFSATYKPDTPDCPLLPIQDWRSCNSGNPDPYAVPAACSSGSYHRLQIQVRSLGKSL